jgi:hypothetical protein
MLGHYDAWKIDPNFGQAGDNCLKCGIITCDNCTAELRNIDARKGDWCNECQGLEA